MSAITYHDAVYLWNMGKVYNAKVIARKIDGVIWVKIRRTWFKDKTLAIQFLDQDSRAIVQDRPKLDVLS